MRAASTQLNQSGPAPHRRMTMQHCMHALRGASARSLPALRQCHAAATCFQVSVTTPAQQSSARHAGMYCWQRTSQLVQRFTVTESTENMRLTMMPRRLHLLHTSLQCCTTYCAMCRRRIGDYVHQLLARLPVNTMAAASRRQAARVAPPSCAFLLCRTKHASSC